MYPGEYQQKRRDELRERFIHGPDPSRLRALLSATEKARNELSGKLVLARSEITRLERELDRTHEQLDHAREILAVLDPARYWQEASSV